MRTEVIAGITTFVTMAYIIFVNPNILGSTGMDPGAVLVATCLAAALGTFIMGLLANYPFAQAPGMGLNAFFAYTICGSMGYSWQAALAAVFISGLVFILITLTGLRKSIVNVIPLYMKKAIAAGIGLFIAYIGIKNAGLLEFVADPGTWFDNGFGVAVINSSIIPAFNFTSPTAILSIIGLIITAVLMLRKVKGSLLIGIVVTSIIGAIMQFGMNIQLGLSLPQGFSVASLAPTFGQFIYGFGDLFDMSQGVGVFLFSLFSVLISLTMVDMFDSLGTFIGTAQKANLLDKDGNLPRVDKAFMADAIATSTGAILGTSTVTTYIESGAGISEGGRTGLTSVVTGILFILGIFLSPVLGIIPVAATAPILIIVGVLMMASVKDIEWDKFEVAIPAFLTVVCMPFAYSIADGIAAGFIMHVFMQVFAGKAKKVSPLLYVIALLFVVRYAIMML